MSRQPYKPKLETRDGLEQVAQGEAYRTEAGKSYNWEIARLCGMVNGVTVQPNPTFQGRECDVLLLRDGKPICAIECTVAHEESEPPPASINTNRFPEGSAWTLKVRNSIKKKVEEATEKWLGVPLVIAVRDLTAHGRFDEFTLGMMYGLFNISLPIYDDDRPSKPFWSPATGTRRPLIEEPWFNRCAGILHSTHLRYLDNSDVLQPNPQASHIFMPNPKSSYPVDRKLFPFAKVPTRLGIGGVEFDD